MFLFHNSCRRYVPEFYDFLDEFEPKHLDQFVAPTVSSLFYTIFVDSNLPAALWPWECTEPLTEMRTEDVFFGSRRPVPRADNLAAFMYRFSINSGILSLLEP